MIVREPGNGSDMHAPEDVRIDKWLWAARFFKTRAIAADAVKGGKIDVNGQRPKPSKLMAVGDRVAIRRGPIEHMVIVKVVTAQRASAPIAQTFYQETAESIETRERVEAELKASALARPQFGGRPTKQERREMLKLKSGAE